MRTTVSSSTIPAIATRSVPRTTVHPDGMHLKLSTTQLDLFGGIFGGNDDEKDDEQLAVYPSLAGSEKFDSLQDYLTKWSKLLEDDPKGYGLTTKIKAVVPSSLPSEEEGKILSAVQLLFQPPSGTGYNDKDDAKSSSDDKVDTNTPSKKKKKKASEGGVEIVIEQSESDNTKLQVRARRCNIDEDTMIKEMSEEAILEQLKKAIRIWKKEANVD
jgi:hypothetical protein